MKFKKLLEELDKFNQLAKLFYLGGAYMIIKDKTYDFDEDILEVFSSKDFYKNVDKTFGKDFQEALLETNFTPWDGNEFSDGGEVDKAIFRGNVKCNNRIYKINIIIDEA